MAVVPTAVDVNTRVAQVLSYGSQLATLFHQYSSTVKRWTVTSERMVRSLDSALATLKLVLKFLAAEIVNEGNDGKKLFSDEGLVYMHLLVTEYGKCLFMLEKKILSWNMGNEVRRSASMRPNEKDIVEMLPKSIDFTDLKVQSEGALLRKMEEMRGNLPYSFTNKRIERLEDVRMHVLLLWQVFSLGKLVSG